MPDGEHAKSVFTAIFPRAGVVISMADEVSEAEQGQFTGPQSFKQDRAGLDLICASEHTVTRHVTTTQRLLGLAIQRC